jgi:hypothetical protein
MTPDRLRQFEDLYHSAPGSVPTAHFYSLLSVDGARLRADGRHGKKPGRRSKTSSNWGGTPNPSSLFILQRATAEYATLR